MTGDGGDGRRLDVSAGEFRALFDAVSTWGRWGERDQGGALHHLDPAHVVAAARLVRDGVTVTLSLPLNTKAAAHNPKPAVHHMTMLPDVDIGSGSLRFAMDYLAFDYHSDTYSHIDALCHVAFEGCLYNGHPAAGITSRGAAVHGIEALKDGLVGRGVLLDIPRLRGASWLEPGEHVLREELEAAERAQGVTVGDGDISWSAPATPVAWPSWARGTPPPPGRVCTLPPCRSSPSGAWPRWAPTATATRRRA
jgi:hypothetical protein